MNSQLQHHLPIYLRGVGPEEPRAITMATTYPHLNKGKSFFYEKTAMIGTTVVVIMLAAGVILLAVAVLLLSVTVVAVELALALALVVHITLLFIISSDLWH